MRIVSLSVTEASRNFADCINRARYQGTTFVLHKNGVAVARIVPEGSAGAEPQAEAETQATVEATPPPPPVPPAGEPAPSQNVFTQTAPDERTPERTAPHAESGARPPVKRYDIW